MEKLTFENLGQYIGKKANEYFNTDKYSLDIEDYIEEVNEDYVCNFGENKYKYNVTLELTKVGVPPLIIRWTRIDTFDNNDNLIETEYYDIF